MIVQAVKYLIKTDRKTICKDWREYNSLRKSCRNLRHKLEEARYSITRHLPQDNIDENSVLACIKTDFLWNKIVDGESKSVAAPKEYYCDYFDDSDKDNWRVCCYRACPYYEFNNMYMKLLGDYRAAIATKRNFWGHKFANVK